jgi:TDG/mug DNA glycosylase family protein
MAAGPQSAKLHAYYANRGNKFWKVLWDTVFTPRHIHSSQYAELLEFDIGLTDLVKSNSGIDNAVSVTNQDIENLKNKIVRFQPKVLAFNGKRSAEIFLGHSVDYGFQDEQINNTRIFVLPSTSLQANGHWEISYWVELSNWINSPKE